MSRKIDKIVIRLIEAYQLVASPFVGLLSGVRLGCRFYPTCSRFAVEKIEREGFLKATPRIIRRILKCNPFNQGGIDLA
jgi:putative membrane protein insertion efficiency factor